MKLLSIFLTLILTTPLMSQSALEIIKKVDEKQRGESSYIEMKIITERPRWTREMEMNAWSKGTDYSLVLITSPAKEKGTVMLKRGKEVWNWIPNIERSIKLPPSMMMQSWMGTDFTNDDLVRQSSIVTDYSHKIVGDSIIEGRECKEIELIPKPDAPVVWGRINSWVDTEDYLQLKVEFYDEDDYLVNVMNSSDIKELGGRTMPTRMEMIPVDKEGHKTIMITEEAKFNMPIEQSFFSTQNMRKVK